MDDQKLLGIAKHQTRLGGIATIILAATVYMLLLFVSLLKGSNWHVAPLTYALIFLVPLTLIDVGIYIYALATKMRLSEVQGKLKIKGLDIDKQTRTLARVYSLFEAGKGLLGLSIFCILTVLGFIALAAFGAFELTEHFAYAIGITLVYMLVLRWIPRLMIEKMGQTKAKFLVNPMFYFGIIFMAFTGLMIYLYFAAPEKLDAPPVVVLGFGIFFFLVSLSLIYRTLPNKGINYEIEGANLILNIPINPFQRRKARIPLKKIKEAMKLSIVEAQALTQSLKAQAGSIYELNKAIIQFAKRKVDYPSLYTGSMDPRNTVYIKGDDFTLIFCVNNAEKFLSEIKK